MKQDRTKAPATTPAPAKPDAITTASGGPHQGKSLNTPTHAPLRRPSPRTQNGN